MSDDTREVVVTDIKIPFTSMVTQSGAPAIHIDCTMEKERAGRKVYNVSIDGISRVITCRTALANQMRNHGVDGLIKVITDKSRSNDARSRRNGG